MTPNLTTRNMYHIRTGILIYIREYSIRLCRFRTMTPIKIARSALRYQQRHLDLVHATGDAFAAFVRIFVKPTRFRENQPSSHGSSAVS